MARKPPALDSDIKPMTTLEFINASRGLARDMLPGLVLDFDLREIFDSLPKDLFRYCVAVFGCLESAHSCKDMHRAQWTEKTSTFPFRRTAADQFAGLEYRLKHCDDPIEKVCPQIMYQVELRQRRFGGVFGESAGLAVCKWAGQVYRDVRKDIYPFCTDEQKKKWEKCFLATPDDALVRYAESSRNKSEKDDSRSRQVSWPEIRLAFYSVQEETNKVLIARRRKPKRDYFGPMDTWRKPAPFPTERLTRAARRVWAILSKTNEPMTVDDFQINHHMGRQTVTDAWKQLEGYNLIVRCRGGGILPAGQYRNRTEKA